MPKMEVLSQQASKRGMDCSLEDKKEDRVTHLNSIYQGYIASIHVHTMYVFMAYYNHKGLQNKAIKMHHNWHLRKIHSTLNWRTTYRKSSI